MKQESGFLDALQIELSQKCHNVKQAQKMLIIPVRIPRHSADSLCSDGDQSDVTASKSTTHIKYTDTNTQIPNNSFRECSGLRL